MHLEEWRNHIPLRVGGQALCFSLEEGNAGRVAFVLAGKKDGRTCSKVALKKGAAFAAPG